MTRLLFAFMILAAAACNHRGPLFRKQSPLERYAQKLRDAGLRNTELGARWLAAYDSGLVDPPVVPLPYRQSGYFSDEAPRAVAIAFDVARGSGLRIALEQRSARPFRLYTELWQQESDGHYRLLHAFDSAARRYDHHADRAGRLLLRLQPELLQKGEYTLSITVGPSLAFPVPGGRIGSIWGDARDGGARSHEGIDIFAPRRTPVLAIAPGTVGRVEQTRRGGKVVWLRPDDRALSLYYAHLEEQWVRAGDRVHTGDTLGLVGTSGNARGTPPHLHLGIYTRGGAIDPKPFVDPAVKRPGNVSKELVGAWVQLRRPLRIEGRWVPAASLLRVTDVAERLIQVRTPDGARLGVARNNTQNTENQSVNINTPDSAGLLDEPRQDAARRTYIPQKAPLSLVGYWGAYALVRYEGQEGWLPRSQLR